MEKSILKSNNETKEENNFMNITPSIQEDSYNFHMIDVVNNDPQVFSSLDPVQQVDLVHDLQRNYGNQYVQSLIKSQNKNKKTNETPLQTKENTNNDSETKTHHPSPKYTKLVLNTLDHQIQLKNTLLQAGVQSRLEIGAINDSLEHEVDAIAKQVMHIPDPFLSSLGCDKRVGGEDCLIQAKVSTVPTSVASLQLKSRLNSLNHGDTLLDAPNRAFFEPRFGQNFSQVHLHTDDNAARIAESIDAKAFTLGNNIVFGVSSSFTDRKLLGHELAHVVQQRSMGGGAMQPRLVQRQKRCPNYGPPNRVEDLANFFELEEINGENVSNDSAFDRMQKLLDATEHRVVPGLKTGGIVSEWKDEGFGPLLCDPHPSSANQVGHFLTAVNFGLNPRFVAEPNAKIIAVSATANTLANTLIPPILLSPPLVTSIRGVLGVPASINDEDVAIGLMVGHEKVADPTIDLRILDPRKFAKQLTTFHRQYNATTPEDLQTFKQANMALGEDPNELKLDAALKLLQGDATTEGIAVNPTQKGNSYEDLLLSLVGWRLGVDIREKKLTDKQKIADWIRTHLSQ